MGAGVLWLHLRADPALGDALRTAIHNITGVTLPPPPPQVPTTPPPVPPPGAPPAPAPGGPPEPGPVIPPPAGPGDGYPLPTRYGNAPQELADALRRRWPAHEWANAAELSKLESGWTRTAINDTVSTRGPCGTRYFIPSLGIWATTELSVGWYQINICAHGGTVSQWSDTDANVAKALDLYHSAGDKYTPWLISARTLGLPT